MAMMRVIHMTLLLTCAMTAAACCFLTYVLVYAVEPTEFSWRLVGGERSISDVERGELDSAYACDPVILAQAPIALQSIADFATEAVIQVNTYDYLHWDQTIPDALNTYFTPLAGRYYYTLFERSRLLTTVETSFYTVSAINIRPAMVIATNNLDGQRSWTVQVPVTLRYQTGVTDSDGGSTAHSQNEVFTVTVLEQRPNRRNFRGVAINDISTQTVRVVDDLDRLE